MTPQDILDFWFGPADPAHPHGRNNMFWWKKDPVFDEDLRERFGVTWHAARAGELDGWVQTDEGTLALVIVLDQFSRNLCRNSPDSWAQDAHALAIAQDAIDRGVDLRLTHYQRSFLYMPLLHSEDREVQAQSVRMFERLDELAPPDLKRTDEGPSYAQQHKAIVDRFGRYPHRNAILGRESTPEELEFLTQPGSSF